MPESYTRFKLATTHKTWETMATKNPENLMASGLNGQTRVLLE